MRQRDKHSLLGGVVLIIFTATIAMAFMWPVSHRTARAQSA
jgi:hypothetical protein